MSDFNKLDFGSQFRYEQVFLKSHATFSLTAFGTGGANQTLTIPHNLGYVPYFKVFYTYVDSKYFSGFAGPGSFDIDGNRVQVDNINATTTNLLVTMANNAAGARTGTVYYRIYEEPQQ